MPCFRAASAGPHKHAAVVSLGDRRFHSHRQLLSRRFLHMVDQFLDRISGDVRRLDRGDDNSAGLTVAHEGNLCKGRSRVNDDE